MYMRTHAKKNRFSSMCHFRNIGKRTLKIHFLAQFQAESHVTPCVTTYDTLIRIYYLVRY